MRSARYRPLFRQFFWIFVIVCIGLGWLGAKPAEGGYVIAARILTVYYFAHFLIVLPLLGIYREDQAAAEFDHGIGPARRRADRRLGAGARTTRA